VKKLKRTRFAKYTNLEDLELSVEKGDFIFIDYVTTIKETGEVFDTTSEDKAKESGILKENTVYEPMLVVVGEGWVLKELDDSLLELELNTPTVIEIPPEKGFGPRDPSKIRRVPVRRFRGQDVSLFPGAQIEVDGSIAVVRSVGSGRVQLDFNPPLAGKTLVYDLTILSRIEDTEEKIKALIHRRLPSIDIGTFTLNMTDEEVTIKPPDESYYLEGVQFSKRGIASDLMRFFQEINKITFLESFERKIDAAANADVVAADDVTEDSAEDAAEATIAEDVIEATDAEVDEEQPELKSDLQDS
jgi:peptidylprolyl isomerase